MLSRELSLKHSRALSAHLTLEEEQYDVRR